MLCKRLLLRGIFLLLALLVENSLRANNRLIQDSETSFFSVYTIQPKGCIPEYGTNTFLYPTLNPKDGSISLQADSLIYRLDTKTESWSRIGTLQFFQSSRRSSKKEFMYYSAFREDGINLTFWSWGVGDVYNFNVQTLEQKRLDYSYPHKNQLGHASYFDSKTGSIYAFGGYGLFSAKNLFTYYDTKLNDWELFRTKSEHIPPPALHSSMIYDSVNTRFIIHINLYSSALNDMIVGNNTYQSNQVWTFSPQTLEWDGIGLYAQTKSPNLEFPFVSYLLSQEMDYSTRFWVGIQQKENPNYPNPLQYLWLINCDTFEQYLFPINFTPTSILHTIFKLVFDSNSRRLYAFATGKFNSLPVLLSYIELPEKDELNTLLKKAERQSKVAKITYETIYFPEKKSANLLVYYILSLLSIVMVVSSWIYYRNQRIKGSHPAKSNSVNSENAPPIIAPISTHESKGTVEQASSYQTIGNPNLFCWIFDFTADSSNPILKFKGLTVLDYTVKLDEKWLLIFMVIFQEQFNTGFDSYYYCKIFGKSRESADSLRKSRQLRIQHLNQYLKEKLGIQKAIQIIKSPEDGRRVFYVLDESLTTGFSIQGDWEKIGANAPIGYRKIVKSLLNKEFNIHQL